MTFFLNVSSTAASILSKTPPSNQTAPRHRERLKFEEYYRTTRRVSGCLVHCSSAAKEVDLQRSESTDHKYGNNVLLEDQDNKYLLMKYGWGVRRMAQLEDEEMRSVAHVQAQAFHVPMLLFDNLSFQFFKAEVFSALIYKIKNSPPDRYACLVAESVNANSVEKVAEIGIVGVVDVTVQRDHDVVKHFHGSEEYLYVSGIGVLRKFRRRRIATALLQACDTLAIHWGFKCLALRVYEDDLAARNLYENTGYKVVSTDPHWYVLLGKRRRILMVKQQPCFH